MEKRIPRRRFKEFVGSGDWEEKKLGEVADRYDNLRIPIAESKRKSGTTPYYGANGIVDYIDGFTHNGEFVLLAEDGANDLNNYPIHYVNGKVWVNNHAHVIQGIDKILKNIFLVYSLKTIDISSYLVGGSRAKLNADTMMQLNIPIPSLAEQEKIGNFFQKLDRLIEINREKLDKLRASKSAYLAEMFPREGEDRPRRRFQGFTGDWEEKKFGDIFEVSQGLQIAINKRFTSPGKNRFFYITNEILKDGSKSKYYVYNPPKNVVCRKNDILMTRTGNTGIIVTNVEGCFHNNFFKIKYDYSYLNKDFICELLSSANMQKKILNSAGNSTIPDLSHRSFYNLSAKFPSLAEQEKIGNFFKKLDDQIEVQEEKLEKLEKMKKAYLAEMFV